MASFPRAKPWLTSGVLLASRLSIALTLSIGAKTNPRPVIGSQLPGLGVFLAWRLRHGSTLNCCPPPRFHHFLGTKDSHRPKASIVGLVKPLGCLWKRENVGHGWLWRSRAFCGVMVSEEQWSYHCTVRDGFLREKKIHGTYIGHASAINGASRQYSQYHIGASHHVKELIIMFTSTIPPNEQTNWLDFDFDAPTEFSTDGWVFSDEMELVRPESLPIPYVFGGNCAISTPDTLFTQNPFDTSFSTSLSKFDIDNFDIWPTEWYDSGTTDNGMPELCQDGDMFTLPALVTSPIESPFTTTTTTTSKSSPQTPDHIYAPKRPCISTQGRKISHPSTSSTKSKSASSSPKTLTEEHRTNHNQIERRYRTSLNDNFSQLRACVPERIIGRDEGEGSKKIGKADVLVGALAYVRELEKKARKLEGERGGLQGSIGVWEDLWEKKRDFKVSS